MILACLTTLDPGLPTMASATGHTEELIAIDKFDPPLRSDSLPCHVCKENDIQRLLLSVGKACDAGCDIPFKNNCCLFHKGGKLFLRTNTTPTPVFICYPMDSNGRRHQTLGTECFSGPNCPPTCAVSVCVCGGFPPKSTWMKAINQGCRATWPGLTASRVRVKKQHWDI